MTQRVVANALGVKFVELDLAMVCHECHEETFYIDLDVLNLEMAALCCNCSMKYQD